MVKLDLEHRNPKSSHCFVNPDSFWAPFWPPFAAMAPFGQPFGVIMTVFWLAFSAYAHLEPPGEPFQHHFNDFVSCLVTLLRIFQVTLLKTHILIGGRLAHSVHPFSFASSPLERASAAKRSEAVALSRPRRRRGPKTTSDALYVLLLWLDTTWDLPVLCNMASTMVLSVFLAAQVFVDFGVILGSVYVSFGDSKWLRIYFC